MSRGLVVKNAAANLARGSATALVAILLPPILTRLLNKDTFTAWSLVNQLAAYVAYFDLGVQTAVARFVAQAHERQDARRLHEVVRTAAALLAVTASLALLMTGGITIALPKLSPDLPPSMLQPARIALLTVAGGLILGLPFSAFAGAFAGIQQSQIPAKILGGARALAAIACISAAFATRTLVPTALALALTQFAGNFLLWRSYQKSIPQASTTIPLSFSCAREIASYCAGLMVWTLASFLVYGMASLLVAHFDYNAMGSYSLAVTLITLITGLVNAAFGALLPFAATLQIRSDDSELGRLLLDSTRWAVLVLAFVAFPIIIAAKPLLTLWAGADYARDGTLILQLMLLSNGLRLTGTPFAMLLAATNQQRLVYFSPLLEGAVSLVGGLWAGPRYGAPGIVAASIAGSVASISLNVFYNLPRTSGILASPASYLSAAFLRPASCIAPLAAAALFALARPNHPPTLLLAIGALAALLAALLTFQLGLTPDERRNLLQRLRPRNAVQPS